MSWLYSFNEKALSLFFFPFVFNSLAHIHIIAKFSRKLSSSEYLHLLIHTHIWTCYIWKLENASTFTDHAKNESGKRQAHLSSQWKIIHATSSAREANEWKGECSANNVPRSRSKCQCFCLGIWAAEMLLWVWLAKGRYSKRCELNVQNTFS